MLEAAGRLAADGVHLLDLTLRGRSLLYWSPPDSIGCWSWYQPSKETTGLPIMVSPGVLSGELSSYGSVRPGRTGTPAIRRRTTGICSRVCVWSKDYDRRKRTRLEAAGCGLLAEDGLLTGVGESAEDLADSILDMAREPLDQVRAMSYVPHESTFHPQPGTRLKSAARTNCWPLPRCGWLWKIG